MGALGVCQLASANSAPGIELERLMSSECPLKCSFQCDSGPDARVDTESRASPSRETVIVPKATRRVDYPSTLESRVVSEHRARAPSRLRAHVREGV